MSAPMHYDSSGRPKHPASECQRLRCFTDEAAFQTNREAHEEAAGMPLDPLFFRANGIDPEAPGAPSGEALHTSATCPHPLCSKCRAAATTEGK